MDLTDLVYIDENGYFYADYPTFLEWITSQYTTIYGADVYVTPDSQDGQFLAILAQAFYDTAALGAAVYNSFSPTTAVGTGLSRLVEINGLERESPSNSTVALVIVGVAGTTITNGAAQDTLMQIWELPSTVTIPSGGTITVTATAQNAGAVASAANTITTIYTPTLGWQTVNNPAQATIGNPVESDGALRVRQSVSTSLPAQTVLDAQIGAILNLPGVTACAGYENDTDTTNGLGIPANTVSLVVAGGTVSEIAQTIALYKTPGCGTYGTTSQTVYDSRGMPLTISFYIPTVETIGVQVTINPLNGYISSYAALIQAAVAAQINSVGIGNTVFLSQLYAPAYLIGTPAGSTFTISQIEINLNGGSFGTSDITIPFYGQPFCNASTNVTVIT